MKLITPPNAMPPCHSAAAIGTLPIEQTNVTTVINGPTIAFSMIVQMPWPSKNTAFHQSIGTSTVRNPATR